MGLNMICNDCIDVEVCRERRMCITKLIAQKAEVEELADMGELEEEQGFTLIINNEYYGPTYDGGAGDGNISSGIGTGSDAKG